jgi:hypothetical protein
MSELVLFPGAEHDDLFDGLQTVVGGATSYPTVRAYRYAPFARWWGVLTFTAAATSTEVPNSNILRWLTFGC